MTILGGGETILTQCNECDIEFELTFEPKAKGIRENDKPDPLSLRFCPFCGNDTLACNDEPRDDHKEDSEDETN